jgi:hypothetical protein
VAGGAVVQSSALGRIAYAVLVECCKSSSKFQTVWQDEDAQAKLKGYASAIFLMEIVALLRLLPPLVLIIKDQFIFQREKTEGEP